MLVFTLTDKYIPYPTSIKFLFSIDRDYYRQPQPIKMKKCELSFKD